MSSLIEQTVERLKELRDQTRYYGLMMGGVLILIELTVYFQHNTLTDNSTALIGLFKIAASLTTAYYLVKKIKKEFFKTGLSYGQSFAIIFRLFLYASLIVGFFSFILNNWIDTKYQEELFNSIQSLSANSKNETSSEFLNNITERLIEQGPESPISAAWSQVLSYVVFGVFIAAITSIFTRDKDINPFAQQEGSDLSNN